MQYLSWASYQIPLAFVRGLSMRKMAKTVEHAGGFVSARGFEGAEISAQIEVDRAKCLALGLDFNEWHGFFENLEIDTDGASGAVTLGGYPLYPELLFAVTNKNMTRLIDLASAAPVAIACDLVLSGVECTKEVSRQRTLEFDAEGLALPKISLTVDGQTLVIQDSTAVSRLIVTPSACELELCLGSDSKRARRESFLKALVGEHKATVTLDLPTGQTLYHVAWAELSGGILRLEGAIFSEASKQTLTETFEDCDLSDIIEYLCGKLGIEANILVHGPVAYHRVNDEPIAALEKLQASAGFVVSSHRGRLTFAFLPDQIEAKAALEGLTVEEDVMHEHISSVVWRDSENEFVHGDDRGERLRIESAFRSTDPKWAKHCLRLAQYRSNAVVVSGPLLPELRHHSQVSISKGQEAVAGIVDFFTLDFVSGQMQLEIRALN